MRKRFLRNISVAAAALALVAYLVSGTRPAKGGNVFQDFGLELNDPFDPFDDQFVTFFERWEDDFLPVRMYLYRNLPFGNVLDPANYPFDAGQMMDPTRVRSMLERAVEGWNDGPIDNFEFAEGLPFADFLQPHVNPQAIFFVDRAQLDGVNLVTFIDPVLGGTLGGGAVAVTSFFYLNQDIDLTGPQTQFPIDVLINDAGAAVIDFDGDDVADLVVPSRKYKKGEILDGDVVFAPTLAGMVLLPDDPSDVSNPPFNLLPQDVPGSADIEAVLLHELGHNHGLAHSNLIATTMYFGASATADGTFQYLVDPWDMREADLDDFISQSILYPSGTGPSAFSGQVIDGDFIDSAGDSPDDMFVLQVPVYATYPAPNDQPNLANTDWFESGGAGSFTNDGRLGSFFDDPDQVLMPFRKIASVVTGLRLRIDLGETSLAPGDENAFAPEEVLNSTFLLPGLPIRDDYAIYLENPALTNVNNVMTSLAPGEVAPNEFFGGADMLLNQGSGVLEDNAGDTRFGNTFVEANVDIEGKISVGVTTVAGGVAGIPLTSGHPVPDKSFTVINVDGQTINTRKQIPGLQTSAMIVTDTPDRTVANWQLNDNVRLQFEVTIVNNGATELEAAGTPANDVRINFRFINEGSTPSTVSLFHIWDVIAYGIEGPVYVKDGTDVIPNAISYSGAEVPSTIIFQDSLNPIFKGALTLREANAGDIAPDTVVIDKYSRLERAKTPPSASGADIVSATNRDVNTGVGIYFAPRVIAPDERLDLAVTIGALTADVPSADSAWADPATFVDTPVYDNGDVAQRLTTVGGGIVEGINIVTDTADDLPANQTAGGTAFEISSNVDGKLPAENWFIEDGDAADFDNDGDLDLVVALLLGDGSGGPAINRLLENRFIPDGSLKFIDVTFGPDGVAGTLDDQLPVFNQASPGVCVADFNRDGFTDIFFSVLQGVSTAGKNRLYLNRGDLSFRDATDDPSPDPDALFVLPGVLDDPFQRTDISTKPFAGDIDSDGDIDLIIPQYAGFTTAPVQGIFQDNRPNPPQPQNNDGVLNDAIASQGADDSDTNSLTGPIARILVNQIFPTRYPGTPFTNPIGSLPFHFLDDTLGRDHAWGGFMPVGGQPIYEFLDRMPPGYPDFPGSVAADPDYVGAANGILAPFLGDNSLDMVIVSTVDANSFPGGGPNTNDPRHRMYNNLDFHDDLTPDGYFEAVDGGTDFRMYSIDGAGIQTDLMPFLTGIGADFPDGVGNDAFPYIEGASRAAAVADFNNTGVNGLILLRDGGNSSFYLAGQFPGTSRTSVGLWGRDFENQEPGFGQNINSLADRGPNTYSPGVPLTYPPGPAPVDMNLANGDPFDYLENTPGTGANQYNFPPQIGTWNETQLATQGTPTDLVVADFNRDGSADALIVGDSAAPMFFQGSPTAAMTDNSATFISDAPTAFSRVAIKGDFDLDGDVDVFIGNFGDQSYLLVNGTFSAPPDLESPTDAPMFYDGTPEFLPTYAALDFNLGGQLQGFMSGITVSSDVADINGDGKVDLVDGNGGAFASLGGENVIMFNSGQPLNDGVKIYQPSTAVHPVNIPHQRGAINFSGNAINIVPAAIDFEGGVNTPTTGIAFSDLDADGDYDIFDVNIGDFLSPGPRLFINLDSDDPFLNPENSILPLNKFPDLDDLGDGIFVTTTGFLPEFLENPLCGVIGVNAFQKVQNSSVGMADLNNDGLPDAVIGNSIQTSGASNVLLMNGSGGQPGVFSDETETRLPTITFNTGGGTCTQGIPDDTIDLALGDFNGDGYIDIFFGNSRETEDMPASRLLINDGTAHFTDRPDLLPEELLTRIGRVGCVLIGDFDGRGETSEDLNYNGLLDPSFDLNDDGSVDTGEDSIMSYRSNNLKSVAANNGALDFVDSNGNGHADLSLDIFIGFTDGTDMLLLNANNGAGLMEDASDQMEQTFVSQVTQGAAAGDLDLDGDLDIVFVANIQEQPVSDAADLTESNVGILVNDGSGRFDDASEEAPFPASITNSGSGHGDGRDVNLMDMDGDGDLDIYVSQAGISQNLTTGFYNFVLINRLVGAGFNAELTDIAQIPGEPAIKVVSPGVGLRGTGIEVLITGQQIEPSAVLDFGPGVTVVSTEFVSNKKIKAHLQISQGAPVGPRMVKMTLPSGGHANSAYGAFAVVTTLPAAPENAARDNWPLYETLNATNFGFTPDIKPSRRLNFE